MQRSSLVSQVLMAAVYVLGCGGSDDSGADSPMFGDTGADEASPEGESSAPGTTSPPGATPEAPSGEEPDPNIGVSPSEPVSPTQPPVSTVPPVPGTTFGNGRVVGNACTLVCSNDLTDPDAAGLTDGWGFESGRSCLTPQSELALNSPACDIPELLPLPALPPAIPTASVARPAGNLSTGFFVADGRLFDAAGNDFVMRGINHPVAWFQDNAIAWMDEIATTGANSVRLVWETNRGSTQVLRASIERAIALGMVPMVELHDITGGTNVADPARMAQYYLDEMRDILVDFEPFLLVNIANEWGQFNTPDADWVEAYRQAISVFRDAGLNHTLVIDANNYGQRGSTIVAEGAGLLEVDPQHNILFSTHMYEEYENPQRMLDVMRGAQAAAIPLIVGEFGFQHGARDGQPIPIPFQTMLGEAARLGLGYLPWSWTGNSEDVGYLDMTEDGSAEQLTDWGSDIINGENGIRATSQPASVFTVP
jgi:hypothetical protein